MSSKPSRPKAPEETAKDAPGSTDPSNGASPALFPPKTADAQDEGPQPPRKRTTNPELQAMAKIDRILSELPSDSAWRVVNWLQHYHSVRPIDLSVDHEDR